MVALLPNILNILNNFKKVKAKNLLFNSKSNILFELRFEETKFVFNFLIL